MTTVNLGNIWASLYTLCCCCLLLVMQLQI